MRIIAGSLRRRTLEAPAGLATRPTGDRLRETLFNVLAPRIDGAGFLDLYAGSGAVGIEAISRGAGRVTFVERAPAALKILRGNLARLNIAAGFGIEPMSVAAYLKRRQAEAEPGFDVVFLDPPYDAIDEYEGALNLLGRATTFLADGAVVIAEHRRKQLLNERYGSLERTRSLLQGDSALSFYEASARVATE
jgi:16S rRNA (guanine(966)-N(2))-methyltransferase RsmD